MRISKLFTKTIKEEPKDEISVNAKLLIKGGFIQKEFAGVYDYLPLGLRVLRKIENIIREEMNSIGGQEVLMTSLQDPFVWQKTNRWSDKVVDNWFKTKLVNGKEVGIANTHEEPITAMLVNFVKSYKDLPIYVYQFQTKFRNELRAKSGILRVREFLMKDLYSFNRTEEDFKKFYELCAKSYMRIFKKVGIGDKTFRTIASGGSFTQGFTDEFQTISPSGEDIIYIDREKKIAINKEVFTDENLKKFGLNKAKLEEAKSIEVGNIFPLGFKYSEKIGLKIKDKDGKEKPVFMGSYGIGVGRLMGTVVEVSHDKDGIIWPETIAPYMVYLFQVENNKELKKITEKIYNDLEKKNIEVLYDDREDKTPGNKFTDCDLIGIPYRIVVSEKTVKNNTVEIKKRNEKKVNFIKINKIISYFK